MDLELCSLYILAIKALHSARKNMFTGSAGRFEDLNTTFRSVVALPPTLQADERA
jgi:hypothetical protein